MYKATPIIKNKNNVNNGEDTPVFGLTNVLSNPTLIVTSLAGIVNPLA